MPKTKINDDAVAFAARLRELLNSHGRQRRGAGSYLARKYNVSTVVANAWLNGEYKPGVKTAERIAQDHGSSLDELYFDRKQRVSSWPFSFAQSRYESLTRGQRLRAEAALLGAIVDMEDEDTFAHSQSASR